MTIRLAITSDLHYDPAGHLTSLEQIQWMIQRLKLVEPDAVIIAGDIAHGLNNFETCLRCFESFEVPIAVLAGNHDIWRDKNGHDSKSLWEKLLPVATERAGYIWLEAQNLHLGHLAVIGSLAWYDYSAIDPQHAHLTTEQIALAKTRMNNDAVLIDWEYNDVEFAQQINTAMQKRLDAANENHSIQSIVVVTHVPILEEQITRNSQDSLWGLSNAFFGNLTVGRPVAQSPKVKAVVSGHTHHGRHGVRNRADMPPIKYEVIGSDYGKPDFIVIEVE